jgi:hypothetical protein
LHKGIHKYWLCWTIWCASLGPEALQTPQGISLIFAKWSRSLLLGLLFIFNHTKPLWNKPPATKKSLVK